MRIFCISQGAGNLPNASSTESHIAPELTSLVMWTIQMQSPPLYQPFDLEIHTCVDEAIEMPICMFERQRVGIREIGCNLKVQFGWKTHERQLLLDSFAQFI
jgi:hypothetical protein